MATPRSRYVRRRKFDRLSRVSRLLGFLNDRADDLNGTATGQVFTATAASNTFTDASHGFSVGEGPYVVSNAGGALPGGLVAGTEYFVGVIDNDNFTLHLNREAARDDDRVTILTDGTGTQTITRASTASAMLSWMKQRVKPRRLAAVTDIDSLP